MDSNGYGIRAVGGVCPADNQMMARGGEDRGQARGAHIGADARLLHAHEVNPVMIDEVVDSVRLVLGTAPARGAKTPLHILGAAPDLDHGNRLSVVLERADPSAILASQA
jgi:hypothetical protein